VSHESGLPELVVTLDPLALEPRRAEVLRYLGYPAGAAAARRIEAKLDQALEDCRGRLRPRGLYAVYPVARLTPRRLTLGGGASFTGPIGEFLGGARRVAVFLATAGQEIVELAEAATRSRAALSGLVYDAIGSQVADAAVTRLAADLRGRIAAGEALTLPYSPGYCGISLAQQRTIFRLLAAHRIGVELLPALIMKPVKSVSGLMGIGPRELVRAAGNPCDRCEKMDCRMRRATLNRAATGCLGTEPRPSGSGPRNRAATGCPLGGERSLEAL